MDNYFIAIIIWLAFIFISRNMNDKANKTLDQEKKAALVDLFAESRYFLFGSLIAIIILLYLCRKYDWLDYMPAYAIYFTLLISTFGINSYLIYKKLKDNDYPSSYIKSYLMVTALRFVGLAVFFTMLLFM